MLSFAFSAFAQSTVSKEADLKAALERGGEVTLGESITVSSYVTIPSGKEVVLNLNGKTLKAANAKTKVLENNGTLTINGQGTVSGIIYNGTANGSTAEMILNGGTYSLDGNSGGLHHYGKTLTINDGVVVKTKSYGVRMSGKKSVLNLYGGTYTSTGSGDMARSLALSNGTVNFLDKDITVNGYMHVMVGQVTVNFGENNQYSPFEAYHQGNSAASSVFYCTTLAEAISRTGFAAVTLVKNVKVADGAPITVNKEINLNLNGKNISATNAKTTVLKNYANLTIKGKGTVTGIVYNGDADNKGVAEMTLNGGTYKLDGNDGGIFNYGKTLTVNDGVTISSQVYGLRMSNAASVINLNGGTFTSTNSTDNMKRAIQVDAGTVNFNDDDITINGYFHANRTKAKVNFGEYCPFDAFMYSTTNASGYYVVNLENAIDKAEAGYEIVLQKNLERSEIVTLPKKVTLDGNGKALTSTAGRAINVDCADVVTIENLTIAGATGCERGINIINKAGTTNIKKVNVSGVSYYAVHVATSAGAAQVNIENSNLTGWAAVAAYGEGGTVNVKNSNLVGVNKYTGNSDDFATVAAGSNIAINVTGGKVTAESFEGKAAQAIVCAQSSVKNAKFTLDAELELKGTAEYVNIDLDNNTVAVREAYGTNFVTTPAVNGLVTLTGASEAEVDGVKYAKLEAAFAAATEGQTITLIADVTPSLTSQKAITKAAVIDLNGKKMTLNEDDLYFGTTTFKNGTIVVAPSVKASTAVFWMFENQTLAFDNVDIVATGVTGTYLIGINGGTGTTVDIINGSSITIENESKANLTAVICDNGTGNTVTIKDSKIDVKNIEGRFYLGGKNGVAVVENTNVDLNGVKEGFYLRAGQSLDIAGTSNVNIVLNSNDGRYGINVTDVNAVYTKGENATVSATVYEVPAAAKIGNFKYASLQAAIDATILMTGDVTVEILAGTYAQDINLTNAVVTTGDVNNRPNITFKAVEDNEVVLAGTVTLGYRQQNVGASMWNGKVTFEGITFDHAQNGKHSLDIQDVKGIALTNCKLIGDGEYGIGSNSGNATTDAVFTNCTFENGSMQVLGQLGAYLVVDNCECNDFSFNVQGGAAPGMTIKNTTFNMTLTNAHVGESFYVVRTNACPVNIEDTEINVDSEVSSVAANQSKWGLFWARQDSDAKWNIANCEVNLTGAAMAQTELLLTKNATTTYDKAKVRIEITNLTSASNNVEDLIARAEGCATVNGVKYLNGKLDLTGMVAYVGGNYFVTVQEALKYAIDNSAAEVVVLADVREKMVTDFDIVIKANLTIKADATKFTAEAPAKVEFYNEGTSYDFTAGTADGAERCTLTIAENVHFDLTDRVIWLGYYGNNVDVVVNGYLGGYQIWHGANTTVNNGGMLDSHGEAFIMRRDATLTANEGSKVKANYFNIYSGHINATGAEITAGLVWVNGAHSYGAEGNVSFTLNNTSFVSNGEVKMTVGEGKNIPVSVTNGSAFTAKGKMTLANSVDVTVDATSSITHNNGQAFKLPVATINGLKYTSLQDAINAVKNGETIVLVDVVTENVTVVQAPDMAFTIDGNGQTMKGTITVDGKSAAYATAGLTVQNVKFDATNIAKDASINLGGNNAIRYTNGVTVDNCTFTGTNKVKVAVKNYTGGCKNVTISNCTATGLHSLAQFKTSTGITLTKNTVTECKNGISVEGSTGVTVTECTVVVDGYGIRANGGSDVTVTSSNVEAFTPVVVRNVTANSNFAFNGKNTMTANDETGKWMVIGDEEYEAGKDLPAEATANVVVALNDTGLDYTDIHGAGLAGKGTEAEPYLINNVGELVLFRNSVNAGSTKFNAAGVCVALNAHIDLAGINWVGIGSMTADHGFMGNFDGKGFKIMNLTIDNPALDSDGYAYAGLFALTEGTDKDNQNVVKNLIIENVTINTTGHIAAAAIAYAYYTNVDNVKVCGNIAINGGDYTAGVLAYTRRCVNASNLAVVGNEGSYIKGAKVVGGVISDIQMNGGLKAVYSNFSAKDIAVIGEQMVGGISGNIAVQTLNGATVENVTLTSGDARVGTVAGCFGGTSTITGVTVNNVTGATAVIGATYDGGKAVEARIGDTYYATFAAAYEAAQAGETVTMLADLTMSEILVLDKAITLDGGNCKLTSTAGRAINVSGADGVTIQNLTINASGERAINVIQGATNVTIDNVTATAANYTVNLAGSAANAVVAIKNSNLTGLNVVNVGAAGADVTVKKTTINTVDNSATEGYSSLALNKDAVNGKIIANDVTINITGSACDDSVQATNAADGGVISINGSTDGVDIDVAAVEYGNYYYGFTTIKAAIEHAQAGQTVKLVRNVTVDQPVAINKAITLDGNGKALTYTGSNRAITVENIADADIDVTIKNLTINNTASYTERGINYNENGTLTLENVTVNGEHTTYAINLPGMSQNAKVVIKDSKFTGLIALNIWGANTQVTADNSEFYSVDNSTAEGYAAIKLNNNGEIAADNATVVINGGKVIAKDENGAASIAVEDCTSGSTVTISSETEVVGSTTKSVAIISYGSQFYTFSTIEEAIEKANAGETIELISDVTISYGARKLLATAAADKAVTIDGKGHTLTLNSTDSDWSSIGLENNNKLVLKNMTVNKAGKGATSGAWNTHAIIFSTAVEMENVTVNNAVAVAADAAFTNVVFNEANGYYSLWIEANGQTVTVKGGSMTATNGGRGIKIADQYISAPAKVTLSVDGTVFNTAKKAAVLVSSKAGAEITAANVNIENVAEDNANFVWVDGDWATYFGNVTVNGAPAVMEDAASFVAAVTANGAVKAYYATIVEAIAAVQDGEEVALVADITVTNNEIIWIRKSVTINGNDHKVTSNANRVFRIDTGNIEVTLNGVNIVSTAVRVGQNDVRGISIDPALQGVVMTLNNCSVDFTDPSANDWAYAVNVSGNGTGHTVTVNGGSYEGANVINAHGANNIITVKGATLTSTYPASDLYYGACFWVLQNQGSSVVAEGNTFEADNAIVFNVGTGTAVTESENVDNTKVYVAKVGTVYYHSVNEAINAAENGATVQLLGDRTIDEAIAPWIGDSQHRGEKSITIQGYAEFGTTLTGGMFLGYNDGTVRDNTITVKGINFVGKGVVVANQKNVVVEGNKFTGINALVSDKHANSNCAVLVIGSKNDMSIAATVKNNVIENVANAGIYLSQVGAVVVEGNTVTGTKHNALTVSAATTATVDVKNNTFAQWGLGGEGRAMRISGAATVNVNENVMSYEGTMPEEFVKVTGATAFNASANYWNGQYLLTEGLLAGVDPLTVANSYYTDAEKQNLVELTATKSVAKVGKTYYVTLAEALTAAQAGDTVTILAGEYTGGLTVNKAITVKGETDADGNNLVAFTGTLSIKANGATVKNLNFTNTSGKAASINAKDVLIEGCSLVGSNALYQSYTSGLVTFKDSYIKGGTYGIHFDGKAGGEIVIENCTVIGWTSLAKTIKKVTITDTEFAEGSQNYVRLYQEDITIKGCTFNEKMMVDLAVNGATAAVDNCTVDGDRTVESLFYGADIVNSEITVDDKLLVRVAKIGDVYYETLAEAVVAAKTGAVVIMVDNAVMTTANLATISDNYAVLVPVKEKAITIDLNGKSVTVNAAAEELAGAKSKMLMSVFGIDTNGNLTLTGNGSVKVNANGANVYSLVAAYGEGSAVVIENGNYEADAVMASGSLIYAQQEECIVVNGGNFKLGNYGTGANASPWIFNTVGKNICGITVNGGTYPNDINHRFWANEVYVPMEKALQANEDGTWTVVDAIVYTTERGTSTGSYDRYVGYASFEEAIAAKKINDCVTLVKDITVEKTITVAAGSVATIDLDGKTMAGVDNNTSGNFYLIDNRGDLTITDSSEKAEGKITLKANIDRQWNASSVVVANNPGGKLAVWDGTIEHLGGTAMAYAVDNLTNGNLGDVNCTIDGGTIKSTYRAVRQFLNSDSKENNLVINGGTIEGANKSIFFHDPSTKANNGTLYVAADAALTGDVYLFVTENSTEWPVEVEIAKAALKGESTVTFKNVPATYYVTEYPTVWVVECSELAELTINEADYAETGYINLVQKNVAELTYVRNFENTGWQSLYLPFGFTITEEMAAEFEFAYIYNASYKKKQTVIDFVEVGAGFELAANYPYMIRAKEVGEKMIVVKDAVLEVTKDVTIDCSSIFETFTFAGNYAANFAPEASAKKKFFELDGSWSKLDTLNPFRFYLQIELRNGSDFPADSDAANSILMRSVDQNGNTTGVDSVDADQNAGLIFDLHGRRVAEPEKGGIYIINGQKVLVK